MTSRHTTPDDRQWAVLIDAARGKVASAGAAVKRARKQVTAAQAERDAAAAELKALVEAHRRSKACPHPEKVAYATKLHALGSANSSAPRVKSIRTYLCQCGAWHLTRLKHYTPKPSDILPNH